MPRVILLVDGETVLTADYAEHVADDSERHPLKHMIVKLCEDVPEVGNPNDYYREHGSRLSLVTVHGLTNRAAQQVVDRELDEVAEATLLQPHLATAEPA